MKKIVLAAICMTFVATLSAQDISLPEPVKTGGKPLMEALNERK